MNACYRVLSTMVLFLLFAIFFWSADVTADELTSAEEKSLREDAKNRRRRIIFNDDGNVPVYHLTEPTAKQLLAQRTTPLLDTQVDTISFCTLFGSFGLFTHDTKIGSVFDVERGVDADGRNHMAKNYVKHFIDSGADALRIVTDYCRQNDKEIFWSLRMNDTHDGSSAWYGKVFFEANSLKKEHPEWMIGVKAKRPKYGSWTAMDFGHREVRDLAFQYTQEVCQNYDIDGVELDFFRHPVFFQDPANGKPCSQADRDKMTELIARIHKMTQVEGRKRGRPILLAVRTPDSVEYCRSIGLDLEEWLRRGYVDLLFASGYFQINPWEYSVALGHRYGAKVYPSLDESRVRDPAAKQKRWATAAYLGRAANVFSAGADGIYVFNYSDLFKPKDTVFKEGYREKFVSRAEMLKLMGSPETLKGKDKTYFASVRGFSKAAGGNLPYKKHLHAPTLNPGAPIKLPPGKQVSLRFPCGEEFDANSPPKQITLTLLFKNLAADDELKVLLNKTPLKHEKPAAGAKLSASRVYEISSAESIHKENLLQLTLKKAAGSKPVSWIDLYLDIVY